MKQQKKDYKYPINNTHEDVLDCDMSPDYNTKYDVYTIYADIGIGGFLWHSDQLGKAGSGLFDLWWPKEAAEQDLISEKLFNNLVEWVKEYIAFYNQPGFLHTSEEWRSFDWKKFNTRGMELARQLKAELGEGFIVQYCQACEEADSQCNTMLTLGLESKNSK